MKLTPELQIVVATPSMREPETISDIPVAGPLVPAIEPIGTVVIPDQITNTPHDALPLATQAEEPATAYPPAEVPGVLENLYRSDFATCLRLARGILFRAGIDTSLADDALNEGYANLHQRHVTAGVPLMNTNPTGLFRTAVTHRAHDMVKAITRARARTVADGETCLAVIPSHAPCSRRYVE